MSKSTVGTQLSLIPSVGLPVCVSGKCTVATRLDPYAENRVGRGMGELDGGQHASRGRRGFAFPLV